jgi:hypothetical protein
LENVIGVEIEMIGNDDFVATQADLVNQKVGVGIDGK